MVNYGEWLIKPMIVTMMMFNDDGWWLINYGDYGEIIMVMIDG